MNTAMKKPTTTQIGLLAIAFIGTLVALYFKNTQFSYAVSVVLILLVLLVSISGVMTYRSEAAQEQSTGINSRLAMTLLILLCAIISFYLISVSSEPIFSESSSISHTAVFAELITHQ